MWTDAVPGTPEVRIGLSTNLPSTVDRYPPSGRKPVDESVKANQRDKAIEQLKGALAIHPQFIAALNGLGVQYMKLGKWEAAYETFSSALKIAPDLFMLHLNCGITLYQLGRFAEAEKETRAGYEQLVSQMNPTASWLVSARTELAMAYDSLHRPQDAARLRAEIATIEKQTAAAKPK